MHSPDGRPVHKYTRTPFLIVSRDSVARKDIYGSIGDATVLQAQLLRGEPESSSVLVAMHPIGAPGYLPAFSELARAGFHVIACATRYSTGDAPLQMENVLLDLGACVKEAKQRFGYQKVVLVGWSGGGSLMAGYQAEAQQRTITRTAAGEPTPLADSALVVPDGLVLMAAHRSRHHLITDFLDPSILDEDRSDERDPELDIYNPQNPNQPPYTEEFLDRYRAAQRERNRRITARALDRLAGLRRAGEPDAEHCFVVQGTMADPRWVDPSVDPNDRRPGWSYLGNPRLANNAASGLARFTTTRGWLSQWSLDYAQVDAFDAAQRISVPVLVIVNSADDACPNSHPHGFFGALRHDDKELRVIAGANHYFSGDDQRSHLAIASSLVTDWSQSHGFIDID
jgi:dienelactone hydrolase